MSKAVRRVLIGGLASFILYPLSFAPLDRLVDGTERTEPGRLADVYGPITWLEREGRFGSRQLLRAWADLWGVLPRHPVRIVAQGTIVSFEATISCTISDIDDINVDDEPLWPLFAIDSATESPNRVVRRESSKDVVKPAKRR